ncbi:hypothetical protein V6Z12_D01G185600 [Gossypium hirsutum]
MLNFNSCSTKLSSFSNSSKVLFVGVTHIYQIRCGHLR